MNPVIVLAHNPAIHTDDCLDPILSRVEVVALITEADDLDDAVGGLIQEHMSRVPGCTYLTTTVPY